MTVTARTKNNLQVEIISRQHHWIGDEPESAGGDDAGPNPYAMLLGALAACKLITVQMYANRKNWPVEGVEIRLETRKVHARDCEDCQSDPNAVVDIIEGEIEFFGDLSSEQKGRLYEISNRCPVHRTLLSETKIRVQPKD